MHVYIHFISTTTSLQWRRMKYTYYNTHPTFSAAFIGHEGLGGWGCEAQLLSVTVITHPA